MMRCTNLSERPSKSNNLDEDVGSHAAPKGEFGTPDGNLYWTVKRRHPNDAYLGARCQAHVEEPLKDLTISPYERYLAPLTLFQSAYGD